MENNYWSADDWLIFKPEFNENLDEYYDIINNYNKIMFSNYDDERNFADELFIKNLDDVNYLEPKCKYYFGFKQNKFNKKIDLSKNTNLTHLILGCDFRVWF